MKKTLVLMIVLSLAAGLFGCGREPYESGGEGLQIVATNFPAYDFARQVAGEGANITLLVPPGSESHSFEPTPQDIIRIQNCDLLICNGGESEAWLEEIMEGQEGEIPTLVMLQCVNALEEEVKEGMQLEGHDEEEHGHGEDMEYDEHVWTSPVNAALICRAICEKLCETDPSMAETYSENCENYCAELQKLDAAFRDIAENAARHTLIFADRFPVRYFVEEYGLEYYAAFPGCAADAEPSARTVAFLIDRVRENDIPAVFYIEFSNEKMADIICEDTGCVKLRFHSCHNVSLDELRAGVSCLELMWSNVESIKEALS